MLLQVALVRDATRTLDDQTEQEVVRVGVLKLRAGLERERRRRLLVRVRNLEGARQALSAAGYAGEIRADGSLVLEQAAALERPDEIASLLVQAGTPPTELLVDEEELEDYFMRLVGANGDKK